MLTADRAHELLRYERSSGKVFWRPRPPEAFESYRIYRSWNAKWAGKEAGCVGAKGYLSVRVDGKNYFLHRVIWLMETGKWPEHQIDHEFGEPADNRFTRMRDVTNAENSKNSKIRSTNTSGRTGVCLEKHNGRWRAFISSDGRTYNLGRFSTFEQAVDARKAAEARHGFHQNHGRAA